LRPPRMETAGGRTNRPPDGVFSRHHLRHHLRAEVANLSHQNALLQEREAARVRAETQTAHAATHSRPPDDGGALVALAAAVQALATQNASIMAVMAPLLLESQAAAMTDAATVPMQVAAPMQVAPMRAPAAAAVQPAARVRAAAAQPAKPAAAAAAPGAEQPAAGWQQAGSRSRRRAHSRLQARVADAQLRRNFVLALRVTDATRLLMWAGYDAQQAEEAAGGRRAAETDEDSAARWLATAAEAGISLPVCLAEAALHRLRDGNRKGQAGGGVVSASFLNAQPAVGGIGVVPQRGDVLRVVFTVASDAEADTVVRFRHQLNDCGMTTYIFDVLSDSEEAQHWALWPTFLTAKAAGKKPQFQRARLMIDGERVLAPAGKSAN
jgi:hypothetical protein